jgi:hypothetical protein
MKCEYRDNCNIYQNYREYCSNKSDCPHRFYQKSLDKSVKATPCAMFGNGFSLENYIQESETNETKEKDIS